MIDIITCTLNVTVYKKIDKLTDICVLQVNEGTILVIKISGKNLIHKNKSHQTVNED